MASYKTYVTIKNQTENDISLSISEIDSHDWDGRSRPDINLNGKTIQAGHELTEREEINRFSTTNMYRLTVSNKNGTIFSERIDQRKARIENYIATDTYKQGDKNYTFERKSKADTLILSITDKALPLPTTRLKFNAGSYKIALNTLEHTYVFTTDKEGAEISFPCWGGTDRRKSYLTDEGDLELAIAICCKNPYDRRPNYNNRATDCSGIRYGLTGVCHQMANRIMYALDSHPNVGSFTPSYKLSYSMYGQYGLDKKDDRDWGRYLAACQEKVNNGRRITFTAEEMTIEQVKNNLLKKAENMDPFSREAVRLEIDHEGSEDLPNLRLKLLIDIAFPQGYDSNKIEQLMQKNRLFHEKHLELAEAMEGAANTKDDMLGYADKANEVFAERMCAIHDILGSEDFEKVFGMKYNSEFTLIDKEFINNADLRVNE